MNTFFHPSNDTSMKDLSIDSVLLELQITKNDYYWALSVSDTNDCKLYLKKYQNSCFINSYNLVLLKALQVNIDLQPVYSYYKLVSYLTEYFSKSENSTSEARKALTKLAYSCICSRQMSVQEAS